MNLGEIFKEGLSYPTNNWVNLVILGIIFVIISLLGQVRGFTNQTVIIAIAAIVSIILAIILQGYKIEIIGEGVKGSSDIPLLSIDNFITGIKSAIVSIVYYIIPAIIVVIIGFLTGATAGIGELGKYINVNALQNTAVNPNVVNATMTSIPQELLGKLFAAFSITVVIAVILFFIFSIFALVAQGRLAESGSLGEALKMGEVISKVGSIGWLKVIAFLILSAIIIFILGFIGSLITLIPFVGAIISALIIAPFIFLFQYYAIGLLYASEE